MDLSNDNNICAYVAKKTSSPINFSKTNFYEIKKFWKPLRPIKNSLIIEKNKIYILKSKEKIRIPNNLAGEMIPYDTGIGDFRAHYAGFFDPGFGHGSSDGEGSKAVLEVRGYDVPFILEHNQIVGRLMYEKLTEFPEKFYGSSIGSNYQKQNLRLSKHFIQD